MPMRNSGGQQLTSARSPVDVLREGLTPEMLNTMHSLFNGYDQQFRAIEHHIVTSQSVKRAIQSGFANTNFQINVPQLMSSQVAPSTNSQLAPP